MHISASALKIKFEAITVANTPAMFVAILLASVYFSFSCITNDSLGYDTDYSNLNIRGKILSLSQETNIQLKNLQ